MRSTGWEWSQKQHGLPGCACTCARVYPRVRVRVSRLHCLCPERGPSSAVQRNGTHSLHPPNEQLALLGGRLCSLARGWPRGWTRAGLTRKPPILRCGKTPTRTCLGSLGGRSSALATVSLTDVWSWRARFPLRKRPSCLDQKIISRALSGGFKYTFNLR